MPETIEVTPSVDINSDFEHFENEKLFQETSSETLKLVSDTKMLLHHRGWALWRCSVLNGEIITIIGDSKVFDHQLNFAAGTNEAFNHPIYTVDELVELTRGNNPAGIRLVHEAKKLGAVIITGKEKKDGK